MNDEINAVIPYIFLSFVFSTITVQRATEKKRWRDSKEQQIRVSDIHIVKKELAENKKKPNKPYYHRIKPKFCKSVT